MGKKLRNVMLHMIGTVMAVSLMFGNTVSVFAEETKSEETVSNRSDAEMTPNSEKLVSQKAPEVGLKDITLNKTDVLNSLMGVTRLVLQWRIFRKVRGEHRTLSGNSF